MAEEAKFPGEEGEVSGDNKQAEVQEVEEKSDTADVPEKESEKNSPWFVAICEINQATKEPIIGETLQSGFQLQVEADKWIKNNAEEDVIYISLRRGKMLRAKIVRKLEEV